MDDEMSEEALQKALATFAPILASTLVAPHELPDARYPARHLVEDALNRKWAETTVPQDIRQALTNTEEALLRSGVSSDEVREGMARLRAFVNTLSPKAYL